MSTRIYVITHKKYIEPDMEGYASLLVGAANSIISDYERDDVGDNISAKNPNYCELTGMYWLWKNRTFDGNIGICHYRRYFVGDNAELLTAAAADELLQNNDIVVLKRETFDSTVYEQYTRYHSDVALAKAQEAIEKQCPDYLQAYREVMEGNQAFLGNMMITSSKIYDSYCEWLFAILFEVEKNIDISALDNYQKRIFGFLAERLLNVYVCHHQLKTAYCSVAQIADESKTNVLKKEIFEMLATGNYDDAFRHGCVGIDKLTAEGSNYYDIKGNLRRLNFLEMVIKGQNKFGGGNILADCEDFDSLMTRFRLAVSVWQVLEHGTVECDILTKLEEAKVSPVHIFSLCFTRTASLPHMMTNLAKSYMAATSYKFALDCFNYALLVDGQNGEVITELVKLLRILGENQIADQYENILRR